jgi:hypothetical protein
VTGRTNRDRCMERRPGARDLVTAVRKSAGRGADHQAAALGAPGGCRAITQIGVQRDAMLAQIRLKAFQNTGLTSLNIPLQVSFTAHDTVPLTCNIVLHPGSSSQLRKWNLSRQSSPELPYQRIGDQKSRSPMLCEWNLRDLGHFQMVRTIHRKIRRPAETRVACLI